MYVTLDTSALFLAQQDGVLSMDEALSLEALAYSDDPRVPEALLDAVERMFLWSLDTTQLPN